MERAGVTVPYLVGTMIELPRAALRAGEIAETAEFFSFGTNDLTQTVFGLSRDDAASFLGAYQRLGIFEHDPFVTLDTDGVGELMRIAAERGRQIRPELEARHLRRAWRRPGLDPLLPRGRARLRLLLALPRADRPARGRAGRVGGRGAGGDPMILRFVSLVSALIVAAALPAVAQNRPLTPAQTRLLAPSTPPTAYIAPTPAPLAPLDQSRPGDRAAGWLVAAAQPTGAHFASAAGGPFLSRRNLSVAAWSAANAVLSKRSAEPALAAGAAGRQPRQRALPRAAAAAQPAELTLAGPDHPRFPGASSRVSSRSGSRLPLSRAFLRRSA